MWDCSDKLWPPQPKTPANRKQVASIAVFYGWVAGFNDAQVIVELHPPRDFYSVDHGHFLPGGPNWTVDTLNALTNPASPNADCAQYLDEAEIRAAASPLSSVTDLDIAGFVAWPPDEWSITLDERVAVATLLSKRRDEMLATVGI
jgi:hypothetical protein